MSRLAQSFLDGLQEIVDQVAGAGISPACFPLLDKMDPALIDFCRKVLLRSEQFATKFLKHYMLKDQPDAVAEEVAGRAERRAAVPIARGRSSR